MNPFCKTDVILEVLFYLVKHLQRREQGPPGALSSCFTGKKEENNAMKRVLGRSRAAKPNVLNLCI